jgi:LysM repeat protein
MLVRLNHLTSPNDLYVGYSLVLLQENDSPPAGKRISVDVGESLLELAIQNSTDPWSLLKDNYLNNSTGILPGDVLRVPGEEDLGPGALPAVISSMKISTLIQGQTTEIQIDGSASLSLSGSLVDHPLNFFEASDKHYIALQGLHSKLDPGLYPVEVNGEDPSGTQIHFSQMVLISPGDYYLESILNVDPITLDPKVTGPEDQLWTQLFSPVSPEKYWDGMFAPPVDPAFVGCYPSWYGARRSYNGSAYNYFHTGQDFCGKIGDPIYAAAAGVVVYAGQLTVRGNAIMIDHGWGVYSAYLHQSEILVNAGDQVEAGQLIGRVGNTGRVEGPHLHFEVIVGGIQVDPLQWLDQVFP